MNGRAWQKRSDAAKVVMTSWAPGVRTGGESWLIHLLALWLLASSLICPDLNFLIYIKTVVSTFYRTAIKIEWRNTRWKSNTSRQSSHLKVLNTEFVYNKNICTYYISTCKIFLNQPLKSIHWMRNPGVHRCISIKKPLHTLALKMMVFKNKWVKVKK